MRTRPLALIASLAALAALAGCDDDTRETPPPDAATLDAAAPDADTPDAAPRDAATADAEPPDAGDPDTLYGPADCEALDPSHCAFPWPSSRFLVPDPRRATGYVLAPAPGTLPTSQTGVPVDPAILHRLDGYPIGTPIMTLLPRLDLGPLPQEDSIERSLAADSPLALFEVTANGARPIPCFAELDLRERDPAARTFIIRPAVLLREDTRYLVALRDLVGTDGAPINPSPAFAALRDGAAEAIPRLAARRDHFEEIFTLLDAAGWQRSSLTLAWDFHTASGEALHGDILHMRDEALDRVGPDGPPLVFDNITEYTPEQDPDIAIEITGHITVPHYMRPVEGFQGATAYVFDRDEDGRPIARGSRDAPFILLVPRRALDGIPMGLMQYGHGLNGHFDQVGAGHQRRTANEYGYLYFGADMIGMSNGDVTNIIGIPYDANRFPWLADRLHQGMLESILLARAMKHRLAAMPQLIERGVVIDPERLYYEGNSQGGIFGATLLALSPDLERGVLGVPGQNYSTLLERSVDFSPFFLIFDAIYQRRRDQLMLLAIMQCLWDAIDPVSHYRHLVVDPHPQSGPNSALLGLAKGDWQVSLLTVEIVARSEVGVALMAHYDPERAPALVTPVDYPYTGAGIVNWHYGNPWPPPGNITPDDAIGDPHGWPRKEPEYRRQMIHFLETGEIIDVCDGAPCVRPVP